MKWKSGAALGCMLGSLPVTSPSRCMHCSHSSHWPGTGRLGWCWIWCKRLSSGVHWKPPLWEEKIKRKQKPHSVQSCGVGCASRADLTGFSCLATYPLEKVVALLPRSGALGQEVFIIQLEPFRLPKQSRFTWTALSTALGSTVSFSKALA